MNSLLSLKLPTEANDHKLLGNVIADSDVLAIAQAAQQYHGLTVVVTADTRHALSLEKKLRQFSPYNVCFFPDWETLPYDSFSPHQDIISARLSALFFLQQPQQAIFVLPINTLMQRLCPPSFLSNNVLLIKQGDKLVLDKLRLQLENAGYRAVEQVLEHGEYAV